MNQAASRRSTEPGRMRDYLWFCLEHVRAYNASWNYHRDMSESEIEADRGAPFLGQARGAWAAVRAKLHETERQAWSLRALSGRADTRELMSSGGNDTALAARKRKR